MERRNKCILEHGQPEKMHACTVCEKLIPGTGYMAQSESWLHIDESTGADCRDLESLCAVVIDGKYMGCPSCKLHNCTMPLISNRHHYCKEHNKYASQCVVTDCTAEAEKGYRTCKQQAHREMEEHRNAKGQAFFKLVERLKQLNIGNVVNSFMGHTGVELDDDAKGEDTPKSDQGD